MAAARYKSHFVPGPTENTKRSEPLAPVSSRRAVLNRMVSRFVDWLVSGSLRRLHSGLQ
jgi:hypothetical protein